VADFPPNGPRPDGEGAPAQSDETAPGATTAAGAAGATAESDDLDAAAQAVQGDLDALAAERRQFRDAYQRAQADFENYRKQAQKRQDDAVARELGGLVERLLPVLDACDAAASQGASDAVGPIVTALYGALEKEGLQRLDPKGEAFDPAVAEAVVHEPGDGGAQVVAEVLRVGYRWRGRVLRPAMVKVTD
jgi:molecular chaperone GrpE